MRSETLHRLLTMACCALFVACMNTSDGTLPCTTNLRTLAVGSSSSCSEAGEDGESADADDDSVSALPPGPQALSDTFFLGTSLDDLLTWDDQADTENLPAVFNIKITQQTDMARMANRSALTRLLQASQKYDASPVITVETLFTTDPASPAEMTARIIDPQWTSYYFNQLQSVIDICAEHDVKVLMVIEPRLLSALASLAAGTPVASLAAATDQAYQLDFIDSESDPLFANTLSGFITATNYLFAKKNAPHVLHAWRIDITASPNGVTWNVLTSPSEQILQEQAILWADFLSSLGITSYSTQIVDLYMGTSDVTLDELMEAHDAISQFSFHLFNETNATVVLDGVPAGNTGDDTDLAALVEDLYENAVTGVIFAPASESADPDEAQAWLEKTINIFDDSAYPIQP